jgi:hypothetical protein
MADKGSGGGGMGFFGVVLTILAVWAVLEGLPTPWGVFKVDLFPPAIRLEQPEVEQADPWEIPR